MNTKDFRKNIDKCADLIEELGLLNSYIYPLSLGVNEDFNKVIFDNESLYENIYLAGLKYSHYNILLNDYSYFQFTIIENENLSFRYSYYPNPFHTFSGDDNNEIIEVNSYFESGLIDFEEYSMILSEMRLLNHAPPIRYDLSYSQYKKVHHPSSHFHLGFNNSSRLSCDYEITPSVFVMLILNYFYKRMWEEIDIGFTLSEKFLRDKIKCVAVDNHYRCELEKRLFTIG